MTTVVFIGAVGRSGTTLLERTLATSPRSVALGEMVHLWERGLHCNEPCGCGQPFAECDFWQAVGQRGFGGWQQLDVEAVRRDQRTVDRNRHIPSLIVARLASKRYRSALARFVDALDRLYSAIHDEVASRAGEQPTVLIDSSKHPSYLFVLRRLPSHQVRLLHVVRDPRGVTHSWAKRVVRPESGDDMERLDTIHSCARWTTHNLFFQLAGALGTKRRRMNYERFTNDPVELGRAIDALLGADAQPSRLAIDGDRVALGVDHTVSGNPMRFTVGEVTIRPDDAWRTEMPPWRRRIVGTLTTPLRQVYAR